MTPTERAYRLLLRAYPRTFRMAYENEMVLVFREQCCERSAPDAGFWVEIVWDVARSAPALRAEAWRARWSENTQTLEVIMRLTAMVTVLVGVYGALNALAEALAGQGGGRTLEGAQLLTVVMGGLAGGMLLIGGVGLLRGTMSGRQTATLASLVSLIMVVATRLVYPWMSVFSQLVAIGLPIALLVALHWPGRRGPSGPRVA